MKAEIPSVAPMPGETERPETVKAQPKTKQSKSFADLTIGELFAMVKAFSKASGRNFPDKPTAFASKDEAIKYAVRLQNEATELAHCILPEEIADNGVDILYYFIDILNEKGIGAEEFGECFTIVHKSNMSKISPDGTVKKDAYGKVLKPEGFIAPDLSKVFES